MYAKLFSSITESSLWSEPKEVRLLFVTMLAKADQTGFVEASVPGLARVANLTVEETVAALSALQHPDPFSKNPDHEGRRITVVPGGFVLLNYEDYRSRRNAAERQEYMRKYMREYRKQSVNSVNNRKQPLTAVNRGEPRLAQAEAEADTDTEAVAAGAACTEPGIPASVPAAAVEVVMMFPVNRTSRNASDEWALTGEKVDEWIEVYPHLNVIQECRAARQWVIDNPSRRKTANGMLAFLNKWLARSQNKGAGNGARTTNQQRESATAGSLEIFRRAAAERAAASASIDCSSRAASGTGTPVLGETHDRVDSAPGRDVAGKSFDFR